MGFRALQIFSYIILFYTNSQSHCANFITFSCHLPHVSCLIHTLVIQLTSSLMVDGNLQQPSTVHCWCSVTWSTDWIMWTQLHAVFMTVVVFQSLSLPGGPGIWTTDLLVTRSPLQPFGYCPPEMFMLLCCSCSSRLSGWEVNLDVYIEFIITKQFLQWPMSKVSFN